MQYETVAVIGGSGFIGEYLIAQLLSAGHQVRVAVSQHVHAQHLKKWPVSVTQCDVHDPVQLTSFLEGADAVVNLVGILQDKRAQPYGAAFKRAHVDLPAKIVLACVAADIRRLLHMSALGADSFGTSMYLRSKGDGEKAVMAGREPPMNLLTTIFRPSVVFGPKDKFLNTFASMQKVIPVIPLACAQAKFQPVFVGDVARAMVNALENDATIGHAYELGGPRIYTLEEVVHFAGTASGHPRTIIALPLWAARMQGAIFECLPNAPITRDNIDSMMVDSVTRGPIDPALGVEPVSMEVVAGEYLKGRPVSRSFAAEFDSTAVPVGAPADQQAP